MPTNTKPEPSAFKVRVMQEKVDLDEKRTKLNDFLLTDPFKKLPLDEQTRMRQQAQAMLQYSNVLKERISHFK